MLVFIDESGDAGFKFDKGSSKYFVIALVIFDSFREAENTASKIRKLLQILNKGSKFEFKFNKSNKELRKLFLNSVTSCDFRIRAMVIKKEKLYNPQARSSENNFYNFALLQALKNNSNSILQAKIKIDGFGDKESKRVLSSYLRSHLNTKEKKVIRDLRFCDSTKEILIQLADMVVGSVRKYYEINDSDSKEYRKILKGKEELVWEVE